VFLAARGQIVQGRNLPFVPPDTLQIAPLTDTESVYLPKKYEMCLVADRGSVYSVEMTLIDYFV